MENSLKFKKGDIVRIISEKRMARVDSWTSGMITNKTLLLVLPLYEKDSLNFRAYFEDELELVNSKLIRALYGAE